MGKKNEAFDRRTEEIRKKIFDSPEPRRGEGERCGQCGEWLGTGGRCVNRH